MRRDALLATSARDPVSRVLIKKYICLHLYDGTVVMCRVPAVSAILRRQMDDEDRYWLEFYHFHLPPALMHQDDWESRTTLPPPAGRQVSLTCKLRWLRYGNLHARS